MALTGFFLVALVVFTITEIAVGAVTGEARTILQQEVDVSTKCGKENNVSGDMIMKMIKAYTIPDTRNTRCFAACHLKGMEMLSDDGSIDWKRVDDIHHAVFNTMRTEDEKAHEVTLACQNTVKKQPDLCDSAWMALKCFLDNGKKVHLRILDDSDLN